MRFYRIRVCNDSAGEILVGINNLIVGIIPVDNRIGILDDNIIIVIDHAADVLRAALSVLVAGDDNLTLSALDGNIHGVIHELAVGDAAGNITQLDGSLVAL